MLARRQLHEWLLAYQLIGLDRNNVEVHGLFTRECIHAISLAVTSMALFPATLCPQATPSTKPAVIKLSDPGVDGSFLKPFKNSRKVMSDWTSGAENSWPPLEMQSQKSVGILSGMQPDGLEVQRRENLLILF
jgi:hypothetical protein